MGFKIACCLLALTAFRCEVNALYSSADIRKTEQSLENNRFSAGIALSDEYIYDDDFNDDDDEMGIWNSMRKMRRKIRANKRKFGRIRRRYSMNRRGWRGSNRWRRHNRWRGRNHWRG